MSKESAHPAGQLLLRKSFTPAYAQLEFGNCEATAYPQWDPNWGEGRQPYVANEERVAIATQPEVEGDVEVEVWNGAPRVRGSGEVIYEGVIRFGEDCARVGTAAGDDLEYVSVKPGEQKVTVIVDAPGYASWLTVNLEPM